ncbi:MAG: TIGR02301 family protein [Hyphomonas sp.]
MKKKRFHALLLSLALAASTSMMPALPQGNLPVRGPDYFRDAADLAGALGGAHAIRVLCNGNEDQYWRRYMADLLAYEAPDAGNLRSSLVSSFNDTYSRTSDQFRICDGRAVEAEARFARTGEDIAGRLATHYFPKNTRRGGGGFE